MYMFTERQTNIFILLISLKLFHLSNEEMQLTFRFLIFKNRLFWLMSWAIWNATMVCGSHLQIFLPLGPILYPVGFYFSVSLFGWHYMASSVIFLLFHKNRVKHIVTRVTETFNWASAKILHSWVKRLVINWEELFSLVLIDIIKVIICHLVETL